MATPKFDTTQTKQNAPGLTYETPKAMPAKFNNLGSILDITNDTIKGAVALDESLTLSSTESQAEQLRKEYEMSSNSNIDTLEAKKAYLEQNISEAEKDNEETVPYETELDDLTNKLVLAKKQIGMSPYEFQVRASKIGEEMIERNPAYADKITAKMSKVFQRGNLATLIKADIDAIETQQANEAAILKTKTDYLTKQFIPWQNMDRDEIEIAFLKEQKIARENLEVDRAVAANVKLTTEQKVNFLNGIETEYPGSGIRGAAQVRWNNLFNQLEALEDSGLPGDKINDARQELIAGSYQYLDWFVSNLPQRNAIEIANNNKFHTNQKELIKSLNDEMVKVVPGNEKQFLENSRDIIKLNNELTELNNGWNEAKAKNIEMTLKSWKLLRESGIDVTSKVSDKEVIDVKNALVGIIMNDGGKLNQNTEAAQVWKSKDSYRPMKSMNNLAIAELADGPMQATTKGYFNNIFLNVDSMSGELKQKELDKLLPLITSRVDSSVLENLMQDGDFSSSTLENMEFYKEALIDTIPDGLELTMSNGLFYYPQDSRINKNITRLNNYILLKAKMEGKKPSQISEEILATDFPMFNIKGQEPKAPVNEVRTWTLEEARAAPEGSVDDNDLVIDENGNARRSGE